jgi:Zn-dependent protease
MLIFVALQGGLLAAVALAMGDRRPRHEGRLTVNPLDHVAAWGALVAALFAMSWVRTVWFDSHENRLGRVGVVLVALAGLVGMAALVPLIDLLRPLAPLLPPTGAQAVLLVLGQLQTIALGSALLNLLPVPGLVGGSVWQAAYPDQERRLRRLEPICMAVVIAAIVAGLLPNPAPLLLPYLHLI